MGALKNYHIGLEESYDMPDPNEGIVSFAANEYEEVLEEAEEKIGETNFFQSCLAFYTKNKFLTEKQMNALRNPRYGHRPTIYKNSRRKYRS